MQILEKAYSTSGCLKSNLDISNLYERLIYMIILKHIQKNYSNKSVLKDINAAFDQKNTIYTIIGKSGSGKTTLFNILLGLDQSYDGEYILGHQDVRTFNYKNWSDVRSNQICTVFQDYKLLENFTVYENLLYASTLEYETTKKRIEELVKIFNLDLEINQKVHQLSGGQKQRLAIARAIFNHPDILLMDEPSANLDEENINDLKKYLQLIKKDTIIIIISHDRDLTDISDITYHLEDGKLDLLNHNSSKEIFVSKSKNTIKRIPPIQYLKTYCKAKLGDIILLNIPIILIIAIFINVFGYLQYDLQSGIDSFYGGIGENTIFISTSNYNQDYINEKEGYSMSDDGTRICFSKEDLAQVRAIAGVKKADLFNTYACSVADHENLTSDYYFLKKDASSYIQSLGSYSKCPEVVSFIFNSMRVSEDYFNSYNKDGIQLISGRVPKSNLDEILIPDILSYQLFGKIVDNLDCKLSVRDQQGNHQEKNYQIVGVYQTNSQIFIDDQYIIYLGYNEYDPNEGNLNVESYQYFKNSDYESNKTIKDYINPIYESYESYEKAIGTGYYDMVIITEDSQLKNVHNEIKKLFPNLSILSQDEIKNGESSEIYKTLTNRYLLLQIGAVVILSVIVLLLSRSYIKGRTKEIAILYMLGYQKQFTYSLLLLEYGLTTFVNVTVAYLFIYIARFFFRGSSILLVMNFIFTPKMMISMSVSIMGIMLLSVIISLMQIKENKLIHHLKEIQ